MLEAAAERKVEEIAFIDLHAQQRRIGARINQAIANVLAHGQYILGPEVRRLESQLSAHCGAKHAIGCASGTDALILALMAMNVGAGDAVFCPSFTFAATAEAVALLGATPIFVDIVAETCNMDPKSLESAIETIKRDSRLRPAGVIAVDLYGQPADYRRINAIAERLGLWVIADAAQSYGAMLDNRRVGTMAKITTTSFFPAKPLGCYGDGGAVFTDDDGLADVIRSLLFHGKGTDKYDNVRIGLNARLDTIQAAILIEKLAVFDDEIGRRQAVADYYTAALKSIARVLAPAAGAKSAWAQYTLVVNNREKAVTYLKEKGIPTAIYYPKPLHQQIAYKKFSSFSGDLKVSENMAQRVFCIPMHPYLDRVTQDRIIAVLREVLAQ